jgi:hypothetical protein
MSPYIASAPQHIIVSNANEDFPLPLSPVITTS